MCQLTTQFYIKYIHSFGRLVAYKLFRVWSCWYYYQTLKKQYNLNGTCNIFWILGWNHGSWIQWLCDAWNVMSEYINQVPSPSSRLAAMDLHYSLFLAIFLHSDRRQFIHLLILLFPLALLSTSLHLPLTVSSSVVSIKVLCI